MIKYAEKERGKKLIDVKYHDEPLVTKSQWKDILLNSEITREFDIKTI